jgi:ubiquitin thioesterase ZRANB1
MVFTARLVFVLGVYLPLLWEQSFCIRTPIALGYTRGHFSALVPLEPYSSRLDRPQSHHPDELRSIFLPLMDRDRKLLPIHFLTEAEVLFIIKNIFYYFYSLNV